MKKIFVFIVFILLPYRFLFAQDTTKVAMTQAQYVKTFTAQSDSLNRMAMKLAVPGASSGDLNQAISYIMKGLHNYSRFRDSTGLRETFDHLSLVYSLQKKYVQAKWFAIQSNTLSRQMKDTINIIRSLNQLAAVKVDIKDYDLAFRDLNEAKQLAKTRRGIDEQIEVQNELVYYYTQKGNSKKANLALSRISFLKDSLANSDNKLALLNKTKARQNVIPQKLNTKFKTPPQESTHHVFITIAIIIGLFGLVLFFYLKRKRR